MSDLRHRAREYCEALQTTICDAMEALIRRAPAQYLWTFRWFQSRPDGNPGPYDPVSTP